MSATVKNNFQEYDPRHRLTGAVVLILLAIILLPILLSNEQDVETPDSEPPVMEVTIGSKKVFVSRITSATPEESSAENDEQKISSSPKNEKEAKTTDKKPEKDIKASKEDSKEEVKETSALFSPMVPAAEKKSSAAKTGTSDKKSGDTSAQKKSSQASVAKKAPAKATTTKTATTTKSSSAVMSGGWILQVGVFSQPANATKKVAELKKKGFSAKTTSVKGSKGMVTKVWLGPFKDRPSAEKMQDRLQHKTRQRGMVVKN